MAKDVEPAGARGTKPSPMTVKRGEASREVRLAAALRDNLRRRKRVGSASVERPLAPERAED